MRNMLSKNYPVPNTNKIRQSARHVLSGGWSGAITACFHLPSVETEGWVGQAEELPELLRRSYASAQRHTRKRDRRTNKTLYKSLGPQREATLSDISENEIEERTKFSKTHWACRRNIEHNQTCKGAAIVVSHQQKYSQHSGTSKVCVVSSTES